MKTGLFVGRHLAARALSTALVALGLIGSTTGAGADRTAPSASQVSMGTVAGRVHVITRSSRRLASAGAYPGRVVATPVEHESSELRNVVVFIQTAPQPSAPVRVSIRQQDEAFVPHTVAITAGSTVHFPNDDLIFHNVFSLSRHNEFDLGRYPRGRSKSRSFDSPGVIKVFCHLHSHMSALIRVFDHPYFAIPDEEGQFTIPNVPPGAYRVAAWHERVGEVARSATVLGRQTSSLTFSLPLPDEE